MADIPFTQIDKERLDILAGTRRGQTDQRAVRWADLGKVNAATRGVHRLVERAVRDLDDIERAITPGDPLDVPLGLSLSTALTPSGARLRADWIGTIVPNGATFYDLRIRESGENDIIHPTASNRYEWQVQRGVTYTVAVRASDRFGNKSAWSPEATIVSATDTDPPAKVTNLSAVAGYGVIWLEWDSVPDGDLSHYEVLEQLAATPAPGEATAATFSTMATASSRGGLEDGVARYYWVRAVDTSGNRGQWSDPASDTTLSGAGVDPVSLAAILNDADNAGIIPSQAIGTVAAEKLVISSLDNLILNNLLQTADGWSLDPGIQIDDAPANIDRARAFLISDDATDRFAEYFLPSGSVSAGESYLISMIARGAGSAPRKFTPRIEVDWLGKDGGQIGASDGESFAPTINTTPHTVARKVTAPTGATSARIRFGRDTSTGDARAAWIAAPRASEMNAGRLLVDGGIYANHMSATELITLSAQIKDAIITDAKIYDLAASKITVAAMNAGITVGSTGVSIGTIEERADDPAARVNAKATRIEPGKVLISGSTSLANWARGGDETKIDGGMVSANTIRANAIEIGNRALQLHGILFDYNEPGENQVAWTAGEIHYVGDDGNPAIASIDAGYGEWASGILYVYWTKDATTLSTSSSASVAFADGNVVLATYRGGDLLSADYGKTIIDGAAIKAESVTSDRMDVGFLNGEMILAEFIDVSTLLTILPDGAVSYGRTSIYDPADGAFFGSSGGTFGFSAGHSGQEIIIGDQGLRLFEAQHFRTLPGSISDIVVTASHEKQPIPAGVAEIRFPVVLGGGGGGATKWASERHWAASDGGNTVVELYDGSTLMHTITSYGGAAGYWGDRHSYDSILGLAGRGWGAHATGYGAAGAGSRASGGPGPHKRGGGKASSPASSGWINISSWADPQIKITIGEGGEGAQAVTSGTWQGKGGDGSPGIVKYQTNTSSLVPANVVPLLPSISGTFSVSSGGGSFPDLGAGLWSIVGNVTGIEIAPIVTLHNSAPRFFISSQTPTYSGGSGTATFVFWRMEHSSV